MISIRALEQAVIAVEQGKDPVQKHWPFCQKYYQSYAYQIQHFYPPTAKDPLKQGLLERTYDSFLATLQQSRDNFANQYLLCEKLSDKLYIDSDPDMRDSYESDPQERSRIESAFRANMSSLLKQSKPLEEQSSRCMEDFKQLMIQQDYQAFQRIIQEGWKLPENWNVPDSDSD